MDNIFSQMMNGIAGISVDVETAAVALVAIGMIILGVVYIVGMLNYSIRQVRSDRYEDEDEDEGC